MTKAFSNAKQLWLNSAAKFSTTKQIAGLSLGQDTPRLSSKTFVVSCSKTNTGYMPNWITKITYKAPRAKIK